MPTTPRIDTVKLGSDAPRLDPSSEGTSILLCKLQTSNLALDNLRKALERDETLYRSGFEQSAQPS